MKRDFDLKKNTSQAAKNPKMKEQFKNKKLNNNRFVQQLFQTLKLPILLYKF